MSGGTFPTAGFNALELKSNTQTRSTQTLSGRTQRSQINSQYFSFKLVSPPLTRTEYAIMAFIMKQGGKFGSFTVVPPLISSTAGTAAGTHTITTNYAAGVSTVVANGGSGTFKTGDLIKFSNHDKVYMLTADTNADTDSTDTFEIFPTLRTAITNSTTIVYDNVPFKVFLTSDTVGANVGSPELFTYEITVREDT